MRDTRHVIAIVTTLSLIASPVAPLFGQAPAATPKKAAPATTASAQPVDGGWPRAYTTPLGAKLLMYQPQIVSWTDQRKMTAYAAVSYAAKGATAPALGSVKIEADTKVAVAERLVNFSSLSVTETNFPTLPKDQLSTVLTEFTSAVPNEDRIIALDRVLANIDTSQLTPHNVEGVKADPPVVFFSKKPAVLIIFDGDPIWSPIDGNDLKFAVNTNWDLFEHTVSKKYFVLNSGTWLTATAVEGPWAPAGTLPDSFSKLPNDPNWKDVKDALPGKKISSSQMPAVFVSTKPAELILLTGEPNYLMVGKGPLLWVSNTESDVFREGKSGAVYYLIAGRWFSASDFTGPWTFATERLPADFKKIPVEHPRSRVLASVPGTSQAIEAVLLAQVPQTASVKKDLKAPEVAYQGEPQFTPIEKTTVSRAVNTDKDIIKVGDLYYMCFQGVWFMAKAATGPWEVTSSVPNQIYEIPVSSPSYNVTQVTVESSSSDTVVFVAAAAYTGMMVAWGCAVWGTGYYYPPYVYYGARYPVYYGHYPTYGYGAAYNPWTGAYTRGAAVYGPYGGAGMASRYNPRTGTYSRGAVAYGPYGARGAGQAYNPRTGAYGATRQGSNVYGSWGATGVQRGDQWATTARTTNNVTGVTRRTTNSSAGSSTSVTGPGGNRSTVARSNDGDLYAGHDGNVYKKGDSGSWQKHDSGGWNDVQQPTQQQRDQAQQARANAGDNATTGQLNRDSAARTQGTQRTNAYGASQRSGGSGSRSYGGGGGGARAGGGRRR